MELIEEKEAPMKKKYVIVGGIILVCSVTAGVAIGEKKQVVTQVYSNQQTKSDDQVAYQAVEKLSASDGLAQVIKQVNTDKKLIAITLDGMTKTAQMVRILQLLEQYKVQATFFTEGILAAEDEQIITQIREKGFDIENYTLSAEKHMEKWSEADLIKDFVKTNQVLKDLTGTRPSLLKCNVTDYTDKVLHSAKAAELEAVVASDYMLSASSFSSYDAAAGFVNKLTNGSIVSIKLGEELDAEEYKPIKEQLTPAEDKQASLVLEQLKGEVVDDKIVQTMTYFVQALSNAGYETVFVKDLLKYDEPIQIETRLKSDGNRQLVQASQMMSKDIKKAAYSLPVEGEKQVGAVPQDAIGTYIAQLKQMNQGKLAPEIKHLRIVKDAVGYVFYGIANHKVLDEVLKELEVSSAKATFFVTSHDLQEHQTQIHAIQKAGHEIGIAVIPSTADTFETVAKNLYLCQKQLQDTFHLTATTVFQPWGNLSDYTKEAVAALNMQLISYDTAMVKSNHKEATSVSQVMADLFSDAIVSVMQGQIIYYRMDYYNDDTLLVALMRAFKAQKIDNIKYQPSDVKLLTQSNKYTGYEIVPVSELLKPEAQPYHYPVLQEALCTPVSHTIGAGYLQGKDVLLAIKNSYIGTPSVNTVATLPGFTEEEIAQIDHTGLVKTTGNEIFLTFDDWGSDAAINKLLYVLEKHHVKATFFVRSNYVANNPNLLRKIAYAGHTIASHTSGHRTLSSRDDATGIFYELNQTDLEALKQDIQLSYKELSQVVGDVSRAGTPALTSWFRPPTLAVGKNAMTMTLDCGYTHIISGNLSTHDYEAKSVAELYDAIQQGLYDEKGDLKKGTIIVMHMSDDAKFTAETIDRLLTENANKNENDPTRFVVGDLTTFLKDE